MTGVELTRLREGRGITQGKLARLMGVSRQTVNRWENGLLPISHRTEVAVKVICGQEEKTDDGLD